MWILAIRRRKKNHLNNPWVRRDGRKDVLGDLMARQK